ncbi:hypothetical protein KWH45_11200 [Xanthomonas campestris pv. mirabilis]|uniref:hypothetical protein n=1 Tax=Xanthomonas TaxID=338 RepID=UPI0011B0673E|nr:MULTISPECIES: hypothetical protein [Xanthomonas]MBV6853983.1 hypothetical protein [Xanthomonas campestris pv. mirabilis]
MNSKSKGMSRDKLKRAAIAVEDLAFFFRQVKSDHLFVASEAINLLLNSGASAESAVANYISPDPNKHFLIGALPRLLLDRDLFPSNDDIVEFSNVALSIELKVEKRARFEIIGKIVCETDGLDEKQLTDLVRALEQLVGDKDARASMLERRKSGSFSWNETIQELMRR